MHTSTSFPRILLLLPMGMVLPLLWPGVAPHLFSTAGLGPHGAWLWTLATLQLSSDLMIGVASLVTAAILIFLVYRNRQALPLAWVMLVIRLFILTAGGTYVIQLGLLSLHVSCLDAYLRAVTAMVSFTTACVVSLLIPKLQQSLKTSIEVPYQEAQLQQALRINRTLLEIVQLTQEHDAVLTAQQVLLKFRETLPVDWLGLGLQVSDSIELTGIWHSPRATGVLTHTTLPPVQRGVGLAWLAIEEQGPVYIDDYASEPRAYPAYLREGLSSVALIPLTDPTAGNTIVMIASKVREHDGWAAWERQLFEAARVAVSSAMERQHHLQQMEAAALKDVLTGLWNRRAFQEDFTAEHARARRHHHSFGLMVLDLDGLKAINDQFGHKAGDRLIQLFGEQLRGNMRVEDRCYRLGGDEFAVLLSHTAVESGEVLLRRVHELMRHIQGQDFPDADVSVGLAFFPEEQMDADGLLRLADERMYAMKAQHHQPAS